jgi:hypothetical protein
MRRIEHREKREWRQFLNGSPPPSALSLRRLLPLQGRACEFGSPRQPWRVVERVVAGKAIDGCELLRHSSPSLSPLLPLLLHSLRAIQAAALQRSRPAQSHWSSSWLYAIAVALPTSLPMMLRRMIENGLVPLRFVLPLFSLCLLLSKYPPPRCLTLHPPPLHPHHHPNTSVSPRLRREARLCVRRAETDARPDLARLDAPVLSWQGRTKD